MHTSQPTISEHIRNLESRLDCKLFDRLGRSIVPTPQAEVLYPKAVSILDELKKLEEKVISTGDDVSGDLIIGASTIPGEYILPTFAAGFKFKYPGISFEIRISDSMRTINKVAEHELLFGVVGTRTSSRKVKFQEVIEDHLILAASTNNPIPSRITIDELLRQPFLLREESSGTRNNLENFLSLKNIRITQLNACAILGSNTAIKEAVKANLGISVISKCAVQDELDNNIIKEVRVDDISLKRHFYIVTPLKRTLPNHYTVFRNSMIKYFA